MSKKFYEAPEIDVILLATEGFLCASGDIDEGDPIPGMDKSDNSEDDGF